MLVRQPFEEAWSRAIPQIGKSFFVINNIDKSSGILNVSYTGDPEKYVDCGTIHSELGVNRADFQVAKASQQWIGPGGGLSLTAANYTQHCQGRPESTSVAAGKIHQFEGWREWWFGFWQGEREGDLRLAIALNI